METECIRDINIYNILQSLIFIILIFINVFYSESVLRNLDMLRIREKKICNVQDWIIINDISIIIFDVSLVLTVVLTV